MMYLLLLLGFVLLVKGADFFVDGCASIAKMLRVPSVIIGLTIVAFGISPCKASRQKKNAFPKEPEFLLKKRCR